MAKVLLVAPTCDGADVGESWGAYQWAARLSERHELTVLTYHKQGHQPASGQLPRARVIEWPEPPLLGRAERLNSMLKPAYVPFYLRAHAWLRAALAHGERFDVAHQPLPVAVRYPSPLAGSGIPYLIGPVGGSLDSPAGFAADDTAPWFVGLRRLDRARLRHDPLLRRTYSDAACVLGIAPYVRDLLSSIPIRRFETLSDTGIEELPAPVERSERTGPVRLLFVGRLVRTKGARDAIAAMAYVRDLPVRLDIVGDGYDRPACEALVAELGLGDRVRIHGSVPREAVSAHYRAADVFVFPSYREAGGTVVAEAMGYGLPLVVCSRGGPGEAVNDACGFRIVPVRPEQYARDIATAIRRLVSDPALRASMGGAARDRVLGVRSWPRIIDRVSQLYAESMPRPLRLG